METKYFPTYKSFSTFNDEWRLSNKKQPNHKIAKAVYYFFIIIGLAIFWLMLKFAISLMLGGKSSSKSYRNSDRYKKVIKEGVLFDTVEYHEK